MDIDTLRTFIAITETGSFTGAGLRVGRTQSAVSQQIRKLEDQLGRRVLTRGNTGTELTADGHKLLPLARDVLDAHSRLMIAFGGSGGTGRVSLGIPELYADKLLPVILERFQIEHADVEVTVVQEESGALLRMLQSGALDLTIYTDTEGQRGETKPLYRSEAVWVGPQDRALEDLDPIPVVVWREGSHYRRVTLNLLERAGRPYRVALTTQSVSGMLSAIAAGIGVGLVLRFNVSPKLRVIEDTVKMPVIPTPQVYLGEADVRRNPAAQAMARHIREAIGGLA